MSGSLWGHYKSDCLSFLQKYSFYLEFLQEATSNAIISHMAEAKSSTLDFCKSLYTLLLKDLIIVGIENATYLRIL